MSAMVLAALTNFGIAAIYYLILVIAVGALNLRPPARYGAYLFFFGCGSIHLLVGLQILSGEGVELHTSPPMLAVNLMQIVGGWTFVSVMAYTGERKVELLQSQEDNSR